MSKTATDLITFALKKIGAIASGETPTASEIQDGFDDLQGMLDVWSLNDLLPVSETEETLSLVADKSDYTIGSTGDFDTTRPIDIIGISLIDGSLEIPLNKLKFGEWKNIALKTTSSNIPTDFYFRSSWPLASLFFYPVPSEAKSIKVYSRKPLITLTDSTDDVDLPPYYLSAIEYNLCLEIADSYGLALSPVIAQKANEKLDAIKSQNLSQNIPFLESDIGCANSKISWTLADFLKGGST